MTDQKAVLQARLDRNYQDYVAGLQSKTADELIALAPEITVAQHLRKELADYCKENDITFLLHFDDPLELVRGYWLGEILGYDPSSEINYMLRSARKDMGSTEYVVSMCAEKALEKGASKFAEEKVPPRSSRGQER